MQLIHFIQKSNFESYYFQLHGQPTWRTPSSTDSSKRTKLKSSGAYSSSGKNDTRTRENVVESPVLPMGLKATKRKGKWKAKTTDVAEELEALNASAYRKLNLMEALNNTKQKEIETR